MSINWYILISFSIILPCFCFVLFFRKKKKTLYTSSLIHGKWKICIKTNLIDNYILRSICARTIKHSLSAWLHHRCHLVCFFHTLSQHLYVLIFFSFHMEGNELVRCSKPHDWSRHKGGPQIQHICIFILGYQSEYL